MMTRNQQPRTKRWRFRFALRWVLGLMAILAIALAFLRAPTMERVAIEKKVRPAVLAFLSGPGDSEKWAAPGGEFEQQTFARVFFLHRYRHGPTTIFNNRNEVLETQHWERNHHIHSDISYRDIMGRVRVTGRLGDMEVISSAEREHFDDFAADLGITKFSIHFPAAQGTWKWYLADDLNPSPRDWLVGDEIIIGATLIRDQHGLVLVWNHHGKRRVTAKELNKSAEQIEQILNSPKSDPSQPYRTFEFDRGWLTHVDGRSTDTFFNAAKSIHRGFGTADRFFVYQYRKKDFYAQLIKSYSTDDRLLGGIPVVDAGFHDSLRISGSHAVLPRIAMLYQFMTQVGLVFDFHFGQLMVVPKGSASTRGDFTKVSEIDPQSALGRFLDSDLDSPDTDYYFHVEDEFDRSSVGRAIEALDERQKQLQPEVTLRWDVPDELVDLPHYQSYAYRPKTYRDQLGQVLIQHSLRCEPDGSTIYIRQNHLAPDSNPTGDESIDLESNR